MTTLETKSQKTTDFCISDIVINGTIQEVFAFFTKRIDAWWPQSYRFSEDGIIGIELETGGVCYEDIEDGRRLKWGHVIDVQPAHSLTIAWQISPMRLLIENMDDASTVCVEFEEHTNKTHIQIKHRDFQKHAEGWQEYLEAMKSPAGWPYCLEHLQKAFEAQES
ncbi:SRPBCC domain-containing protein [Polycladidibacter stylochi]|uniref:SRPBCC domain-containing protein n=1 Tax=Polycladidibacter stylochi TaxID=1807766 RepID=UPI0008358055|nr:SRPBCC domain-containing protein [Pseudovibrio stylochi]